MRIVAILHALEKVQQERKHHVASLREESVYDLVDNVVAQAREVVRQAHVLGHHSTVELVVHQLDHIREHLALIQNELGLADVQWNSFDHLLQHCRCLGRVHQRRHDDARQERKDHLGTCVTKGALGRRFGGRQ